MILNSEVIITDLEVRVKCVLYGLTLPLGKRCPALQSFLPCNRRALVAATASLTILDP